MLALLPVGALAQSPEGVGIRASGMAGAFVAVADDPSATSWNPGGLAAGALFGASFDVSGQASPRDEGSSRGRLNGRLWQLAVVTPPLGLSYVKRHIGGRDGRSATVPRPGDLAVARLDTQHVGITLVQSLTDGVAAGATVKFLRGTAASGVAAAATSGDAADLADALADRSEFAVDVDLGIHAVRGPVRAGLLLSSATAPAFATPGGDELTLERQVRAGVAWQATSQWLVSVDADLLEAETLEGRRRRAAVGTEYWEVSRRFGVRGGVRLDTSGPRRPVGTFGASLAARPGFFIEGFGAVGAPEADRAWGLAVRATF